MNKQEIRRKMKIKRLYLGEIVRLEADRAIAETFLSAFGAYNGYFVYNGFGTEARTDIIISALLKAGKSVYLPRVEGEDIVPVPYFKGAETKKGAFGVDEPAHRSNAALPAEDDKRNTHEHLAYDKHYYRDDNVVLHKRGNKPDKGDAYYHHEHYGERRPREQVL